MSMNYELTIKLRVSTDNPQGVDCPKFRWLLQERLRDCGDGRRRFAVEMIVHGLMQELEDTAHGNLEGAMIKRFGQQVIHDGRNSMARWHSETEKRWPTVKKPQLHWEPTVEIVRCDDG